MQIKTNQDVGNAVAEVIEGATIQTSALESIASIAGQRWGTEVPGRNDASEAGDAYCDARGFEDPTVRKSRKSEVVALFKAHTFVVDAAATVRADSRWDNKLGYPEMVKLSRKINAAKGNIPEAVEAFFFKKPAAVLSLADELVAIATKLTKLPTRKNTKNGKAVDSCLKALADAGINPKS